MPRSRSCPCRPFGDRPESAPLTFEVASIKPSAADTHGTMFQIQPGGGLRVTGVTLKMLLATAYDVREFQIAGGPGWINSDRYDIVGKTERSAGSQNLPDDPRKQSDEQRRTSQEQMRQRLQSLMAERFHLAVHRETKELPVYALVVGKSGSKLQPAKGGGPDQMRMGRAEISGQSVQLQMLTPMLANVLGRPVIDKTGLTGKFDFKLEWTPDPNQAFGNFGPLPREWRLRRHRTPTARPFSRPSRNNWGSVWNRRRVQRR